MTQALANSNINDIRLGYDAGNIDITHLVNLDLNGHTAGEITYNSDETGEVSVLNSGAPTTINSLIVTAPNATFNLSSGITVDGATIVNNVAVGTFNTKAQHNGKVIVKDPDGGSINFTDATVNGGIEINPEIEASEPVIIRGTAPLVSAFGNATIKILGSNPKVLLEGTAHDISIEAPNSEFELSAEGDASKIIVAETAEGSKITTSKHYEFELLFTEGQKVSNMTSSGLFGDKEIRVVGYPSEEESVTVNQLLKLDGPTLSVLYTFEEADLIVGQEGVIGSEANLFKVDIESKKVLIKGEVPAKEIRKYLEENNLFDVSDDFNEGRIVMSFYDVKGNDIVLHQSDKMDNEPDWEYNKSMRVLVGTNEQHGLYILTKKPSNQ